MQRVEIKTGLSEGATEAIITVLAIVAFGLGWALVEVKRTHGTENPPGPGIEKTARATLEERPAASPRIAAPSQYALVTTTSKGDIGRWNKRNKRTKRTKREERNETALQSPARIWAQ